MPERVFIGLGANLGERAANLEAAVKRLGSTPAVRVVRRSSLYETAPIGPAQPRYLNAVVEVETGLSPRALLEALQRVERELGRHRREKWGPREIDLDLLLWGERQVDEPGLRIPHPGLPSRRFVLEPLAELAPELLHPVSGRAVRELLSATLDQDAARLESAGWP